MTRRSFSLAFSGAAVTAGAITAAAQDAVPPARKSRLKLGVTRGVFRNSGLSFEDMCKEAVKAGATGFDLVGTQDFPTLKKYGLIPTMVPGGGGTLPDALVRKENHDRVEKDMHAIIDICAAVGAPNLITFSGNRRGMADSEGMDNCVLFLNKVKAHAEDKGVTICMELLNSKVDHKDYMCDHSAWGVEMCRRVNSPRVKLLYDVYHMQIMEGDIIRTIRQNLQFFGHFHTGGNPGRNEIDDTQEINYRLVAKTLAELGYQGWVSHEYSPKRNWKESLDQANAIFTV
jgi:hydroxypyruvate isomerase